MDIQQEHQDKEKKGFIIVSINESFFFYDSLIRRAGIEKDIRSIVRAICSNQLSCFFVPSIVGKQLFRQYDGFNGNTFLSYIKLIHLFPKCYLFMNKASSHYKSKKMRLF